MVLRDVLLMTAIGLAIGVPLALSGAQYVRSLLYGVEADDPIAMLAAMTLLVGCCVAAGIIPAGRASRIDPMAAVRHE